MTNILSIEQNNITFYWDGCNFVETKPESQEMGVEEMGVALRFCEQNDIFNYRTMTFLEEKEIYETDEDGEEYLESIDETVIKEVEIEFKSRSEIALEQAEKIAEELEQLGFETNIIESTQSCSTYIEFYKEDENEARRTIRISDHKATSSCEGFDYGIELNEEFDFSMVS